MDEDGASSESKNALKELMAQLDNHICADCNTPDPKWASTNIGIFICIKCSGVHRSLGVHVSKVLSVTLDDWTDSQIETMLAVGGNAAANATYEAYLPHDLVKPGPDASVEERSDFIRRKYEEQEFLKPSLRIASSSSSSSSYSKHHDQLLKGNYSCKQASSLDQKASKKMVGMVEFQGLLKVRVIRGTNLAVRDVLTSDPYVVLTVGQQTVKTHVVNSNLNPVWNEELMLSVPCPPPPLKVQVYDKDIFSRDDIMGVAEVDLQPLVSAARIHEGIKGHGHMQIGKWLATTDNALTHDSIIWLTDDGEMKQELSLKLQNVECGELDLELEWVALTQ